MPSLTKHLLDLDIPAFEAATQHPFLSAASTNSLPTGKLQAWLGQDRLYQLAYVNFIGSTLSRIAIPAGADREQSLEWRTTNLLIDSLTNIRDEMKFFEDTAKGEGWLDVICDVEPSHATRVYQDLFAGATAQGRPLIVALVVLWATEYCYLQAWSFAKDEMEAGWGEDGVMRREFIPAWTSELFREFVERIRGLVDEFGKLYFENGREWKECEIAFRQVLWAEREFWPNV